ncbi:valine--tRNA ligase [Candidatus Woesebacteria bacterium RIFCSPLOWO2_01_FULL_39_23]|uniref:Valine--tRNA ligase n=1 Tax=Candidatus Woesebacteria bacterium RIFCSPHIGHO2_01_FULL_40_22 TaxID=1802499 RepID=A0A1F7YFS8_9BACT|nr:MAG: valine--tRNA ligase [Candidatus Woesebacteria bacterium RIFCSPHIGHO2_01_FULL_40_22]OGM37983.1 MAG: valine--tRNA ligase [Candidatus Woesebacteria bacterium RIFCSPHIGHO2_12_FULL_38_9]OGM62355.1 MAG: valine--tRNA ligase [Candidatus Woesebacteria bacterium RIFCSPLOWO2_01_FULL_39_23]
MDKIYNHKLYEEKIYELWEKSGAFIAKRDPKKKPYTIVLPPPNASGRMHTGNVLMIAIEDLLIRRKRMQGFETLWIPGTDHAGFETQITYERELKKAGKSRFDFDRNTLYKNIENFVFKNKNLIEKQIRNMGASVDWTRYKFTLDPDVVNTVTATFQKLHKDKLIYRDNYLVNFCPICGTTFADLEVKHKTRTDPLYYIKYPLKDSHDFIVVATVRPETMFGDVAISVNPKDKRYNKLIGKTALLPLTKREIPIIEDFMVDINFGTGAVKITPGHDPNDFQVAKRHNLTTISVIDINGKMTLPSDADYKNIDGLTVNKAREKTVQELKEKNLIENIDNTYEHSVAVCYKGGHDIEPTILPNWFVKVKTLKEPAHEVVKKGDVKIYPKWQESKYHRWMESMLDWPISRQVVWGIRIPAWYSVIENENLFITFLNKGKTEAGDVKSLLKKYAFKEIEKGLQTLIAPQTAKYVISNNKPGDDFLQETDTFDTWFSSGQWPLVTLGYPNSDDFNYFYPTDVLETAWEILRLWVSRMIMFGIYLTGKPPFKDVYLHGIVRALDGKKMSKSLGNVINPEEYQDEFGTDALRMGLISGTANGKDFNFPRDKVLAYRNFANKIWNIARFILMMFESKEIEIPFFSEVMLDKITNSDRDILSKMEKTITNVDLSLNKYRFAEAADFIYHFIWDDLASNFLETSKQRSDKNISLSVLRHVYLTSLKLLHPFMPFITEAIWGELKDLRKYPDELLITAKWPNKSS